MAAFGRARLPVAIVLGLAGFATAGRCAEREPIKFPDTQYEPVEWTSLDGWATDDHATAFATFLESCRALNGSRQSSAESSTIADALRAV
ncbi:MAG: hypothetical protein ACXWJ8_13150, partial [Xanthobacteraceae bacterium]